MQLKNRKSRMHMVLAILFWTAMMHAQESVNASGSNGSGAGGTIAASVGQVVYTTHSGNNAVLAQGIQHAYEIFALNTLDIISDITLLAFPNPTSDHLVLQITDVASAKLHYELFDIQGRILKNNTLSEQKTIVDMSEFPAATYLLIVADQNYKKRRSFKIIKS